jgi:hypothetical protein
MLLQRTEFPLGTVYYIEQLKVILKYRVWDAEGEAGQHGSMAILRCQATEPSIEIHGTLFKRNSERKM